MRTGTMVVALTLSGAIGGVLGALLVQGLAGPASPPSEVGGVSARAPAGGPDLEKEVASLRARLDEMQASVSASSEESAKVRHDLDEERKAAVSAREKIAALEASGAARDAGAPNPAGSPLVTWTNAEGGPGLRKALVGAMDGLPQRLRKAMELQQKTEEERWAAAREALGLVPSQEEELKAAIRERRDAMKDAMLKMEARDIKSADGNTQISFSVPDPEKAAEARKRYDDRVNSTLNPDQSKKWREEGYEQALGASPMAFSMATIRADALETK